MTDSTDDGGTPEIGVDRGHIDQRELADLRSLTSSLLHDDVVSKHGQTVIPPEEENHPERVGGWDGYNLDEVKNSVQLADTDTVTGRTASSMCFEELSGAVSESDTAYKTHYNSDNLPDEAQDPPELTYAHKTMATYAFLDALGVRVPRHTYNIEDQWIASSGFDGEAIQRIDTQSAELVIREQFVDQMAAHLLAGNYDLHAGNVFVKSNGEVQCIDLDFGGNRYSNHDELRNRIEKAVATRKKIDTRREQNSELDVTIEDISQRMHEIADALVEENQVDIIISVVETYDGIFNDISGTRFAENIRNNIELLTE